MRRFLSLIFSLTILNAEELFDRNNVGKFRSNILIPFPECFTSKFASDVLQPRIIENLFQIKLKEEERKLIQERERNINLNNDDIMDFDEMQLRSDTHNGVLLSRTATKVADELLFQLSCLTNATVTDQLNAFLRKIRLPPSLCIFRANPNCAGLTQYRTITGVCNNPRRPYQGSSQTAFGRLLPAAYEDGLSKPRSRSVLGGRLPPCRRISLSMDSKPNFDSRINNLWVSYGQFLIHDVTLSTPVSDSGRTPITSCSCISINTDMCTVIDVSANDPFMSGQKCLAIPATSQAFADQICALGVKEQMNGNSHYLDLSLVYGSTRITAGNLRTGFDGLMKTLRQPGFRFDLPATQREGRSCIDSTDTQKCFAGGDSRIMENSILSSLHAQWLRMHNTFARELAKIRPDWRFNDRILYEEAKKILTALHQHYTYTEWLPILIGKQKTQQYVGDDSAFTRYNSTISGVVFNEAATAVLRLHTFVRDLVSRCRPDGKLIDQLWFNDIAARCQFAYDTRTNGLDSFLCGALFDYSFAGDSNYAQQIHHRLFESTNHQGETRRSDIVALNICRGREHGIPGYNAYRQFCGLRRAHHFEDFLDTMNGESIQKLKMIYQHPEDVDLFVGVNHERHLPDAVVGPVSACIIGIQFQHLKYGDRLFYTHQGEFTSNQLNSIKKYSYTCFICHSIDIEKVARNPFRPPDEITNPLQPCNQCPILDLSPWRVPTPV